MTRDSPQDSRPSFTRAALRNGMRQAMPLQLAMIPFGLVCGVVAEGKGLSLLEAVLMSAFCYAGSAQLLALSQWAVPVPVLAVTLAAFVVNLRLALMGPVVGPWLDRVRGWRLWTSLFMMADQNWAMSVREMQTGRGDAGFLFGSGLVMWITWVVTTAAGHVMGGTLRPPGGHPLFFAALAVFVAICAAMWRGRRDLLPYAVAGLVAVASFRLLGGTWYIILGALAGAAAGVIRDRRA
jgi:4-azaleucine resistance transporter AzlC